MAELRTVRRPPRSYWEDVVWGPVALVGLLTIGFALVLGIVAGLNAGEVIGGTGTEVDAGIAVALQRVVAPTMFAGAALLMTSVAIVLHRIVKTIRFERAESFRMYLPRLLQRGG